MLFTLDVPLAPGLHGAAGPYDEIINLIPVLIGGIVLLYFYFSSRRGAAASEPEDEQDE